MNGKSHLVIFLLCTVILLFLIQANDARAELRAAIAVRDVTPDPLLPISGGVGPTNPANRKIGKLTVRALTVENNGVRVTLCSTDFLGFPGVLCNKVRQRVQGVPPENILIGATHNHSAPDCYGFPDQSGKTAADIQYLDSVCEKLADAINETVAKLKPSLVKIATGRARGRIAYNYYAEQLYDPRCDVIQFLDRQHKPLASLVNYACHPEVIGPGQGILCPDFVGPLYDRIRERSGGFGIFMNSTLGGMVTADCRGPDGKDNQTWDECIRIGHRLADEALRIAADAPVQENPKLFCDHTTIKFPVDNDALRAIVQMSPLGFQLDQAGRVGTQVNVVNLGNAQMLTVPGEALPNVGYYLKRKMHGEHNLLLGLTNDAFGYMMVKVDWNSFDRYEYITRTCLGELTGEIFIEEALKFVKAADPAVRQHRQVRI
ncbi:hypothetical protein ACFL5Z_04615, partial [Planctomycetota bacterium]